MVRIRWVFFFVLLWASLCITGCQADTPAEGVDKASPEATLATRLPQSASPTPGSAPATQTPVESVMEPTPSPQSIVNEEAPTQTPEPTEVLACVRIYYEDFAQVELVSSQDVRVLIDIHDPAKLTRPASDRDALLTTHTHFDHVNDAFLASFPGQQLFVRAGALSLPGVEITGIPSAHNTGERLKEEGGTNYIYLVEMDGLRIAHFGDIGQDALTQDQLEQLGRVDVAITQLANSYSDMNIQNRKGFNLMAQVNPRWIIPTHLNLETATAAVEFWEGMYTDQPFVSICLNELPAGTQWNGNSVIVLMGENARQFAERLGLAKYESVP